VEDWRRIPAEGFTYVGYRRKSTVKDKTLRNTLREIVSGKVLFDEPMSRHTSMRVGGPADALVFPDNLDALGKVFKLLQHLRMPFIPIGNGTNLIVKDGGYRGALISLKDIKSIRLEERGAAQVALYADAGIALSEIVLLAAGKSLTGMEFCAGIPGTVGGAVRMNAGAWGTELKDAVDSVELMNGSGDIRRCKRETLNFSYRNLEITKNAIITGASFLLSRGIKKQIKERITEIVEMRKAKHPLEYYNAGSIFKNPRGGIPAGQIIDELGLKGTQVGGAKISEKHGNFIVNVSSATAGDVLGLIEMVKNKVKQYRGIDLETEVKIIGED
jgi:UDP-N-acetylmuramate dehydrogenase